MSYATVGDVTSLFRDLDTTTTAAVTEAEVQVFLDNTTEIINAKIGTLYSLVNEITEENNPKSFAILKQVQMYMVAGIVDDILNNYSEADKKPMWGEKAEKILMALVPKRMSGKKQPVPTMTLPDTPYQGTSTQRGKIGVSATSGRIFTKGGKNW